MRVKMIVKPANSKDREMDAYDIKNKIHEVWQNLSVMPCPASLVKEFKEVPVYVEVGDKLVKVVEVKEIDGRIILGTRDD